MANTLVTPIWTLKEVLRYWTNNIRFVRNLTRTYSDEYVQSGAKVGNTIKVRKPQRFETSSGQAFQAQNLFDETVNISLTEQLHVDFKYSSQELTTELDNIRKRYVMPAADTLANAADVKAFNDTYFEVYHAIGTPGVGSPSTVDSYLDAGVKLTNSGTMDSGRVAVLSPKQMAAIVGGTATYFNPSAKISENYRRGQFGSGQLGIDDWYQDPNTSVHTTGTFTASTPLVNGASQTGATLNTDGWASSAATLNKGDIFTIADVFSVNPISHVSTGELQQFVVTATTTSSGVNMATLPISPSIITSGALQTVSASPANNAVITVLGATSATSGTLATTTSKQGMVFHPDFAAFVTADLVQPEGGAKSERVVARDWGVSLRLVQQFNIQTDQNATRIDLLCGAAAVWPDRAVRIYT